jgi:hypothetical protein
VPEGVDDAVLITDVPVRSGWRNVVEPSGAHPRLAAKRPKARPDLYTDCEASLWMDGSVHVLDDRFITLVRQKLQQHEIVLWDHPEDRNCLFEEARHCHDWGKWPDEPFIEQANHYLAAGMPEGFGLWAATCLARRHNSRMAALGDSWLGEIQRWSIRDQVSLPYLLWRDGIAPGTFGIDQLENDMIAWMPHAAELRNHRRTVLNLERRLIDAEGRAENSAILLGNLQAEHDRLQARKAVRIALALASLTKPLRRSRGQEPREQH